MRARPDAPLVFVLPGLRGDEPGAAEFRSAIANVAIPVALDHPGMDRPARLLSDLRSTGQLAADAIVGRQPEGDIRLVGVSFGGCVAYEAASALRARGREVRSLILFDPPFGGIEPSRYGRSSGWRRVAVAALRLLTRREATKVAALSLGSLAGRRERIAHFLIGFLRRQAIARWCPAPLARMEGLVAVSEEFADVTVADVRRLLPATEILVLPGGHADIKATASPRVIERLALTDRRAGVPGDSA